MEVLEVKTVKLRLSEDTHGVYGKFLTVDLSVYAKPEEGTCLDGVLLLETLQKGIARNANLATAIALSNLADYYREQYKKDLKFLEEVSEMDK